MGGDHRAAGRRIVVGRLLVKGVVAGDWQGRRWVEVHTGVSIGGGF